MIDGGMVRADFLVVDRDRDALVAEGARGLADEFGTPDGFGVDGNLVGAGAQQPVDVLQRPYAAADGERHEDLFRHPFDDLDHAPPRLLRSARCRARSVRRRHSHCRPLPSSPGCRRSARFRRTACTSPAVRRAAGISGSVAFSAFRAFHGFQRRKLPTSSMPLSWLFSGWNCVATILSFATIAVTRWP